MNKENRASAAKLSAPSGQKDHLVRKILRGLILLGLSLTILLVAGWFALRWVPLPAALFSPPASNTEFLDRSGEPLRIARPQHEPFGRPVAYEEIPATLIQATLAAEDHRFWKHPGVDWRATSRAFVQLIRHRRILSGGSTIPQQLIKLAHPRSRTPRTKIIEALQALRLEQIWDKQRILSEYLNRLEYGNYNRGCSAASGFYFDKSLKDLSPAECALLAGLPQAPSRLNPLLNLEGAKRRQQWVLGQMRRHGWLNEEQYHRARQEPLRLNNSRRVFEAPHFIDLLSEIAQTRIGPVRTTLDLGLTRFVQRSLQGHLRDLREQDVRNGAVVVLDNRTREVLALVGSQDYFAPQSGQVNGAWTPRSAGSTFKPFTYLLALEQGASPASIAADVPTTFATTTGLFTPANYDQRCYGPVTYRHALANSLNISAVKVLEKAGGPKALLKRLKECGLTTLNRSADHYGLGLTIGNAEARLLELANAYACLATLGIYQPCRFLLNGQHQTSAKRVTDPVNAYLIADMLSDNAARAMAFGSHSPLRFNFPVACKTGTSSDFRDNWAIGYTPEFTVAVWVGNFDGSPMKGVSGISGAAPVMHDVMEHLHQRFGTTWFDPPREIVEALINPLTGKRPQHDAPNQLNFVIKEKFAPDALPEMEGPSDYSPSGQILLEEEYREWLNGPGNWLAGQMSIRAQSQVVRIRFPLPGSTIYLDPDLPDGGRRLYLQGQGPAPIEWGCNSLRLDREGDRTVLVMSEGRHEITAKTACTGQIARTWIEVLSR